MRNFTKRQWLTLIVIGVANFCNAICVSLQAPFYPKIAEEKGCTATEYGLVFGIFELVVFVISPIYGQHIQKLGVTALFNGGIYTSGITSILFGLLDKLDNYYPFIILSFLIRIVGAMGNAAFLTASFSIIAKEFPDSLSTTFASLETFFGFGLIVGPTVGGVLFEFGGYTTPFAVTGTALFTVAILTHFILPRLENGDNREKGPSVFKALKVPSIFLATVSNVLTSMSIGFLQATLEPHLRQFSLSAITLGIMFVINGGTYAITAPGYGRLCDKGYNAKAIILVGTIFVTAGFCLIGPAPFISVKPTLWITIVGLILHGLGMSSQLVSTFSDSLRTSIAVGFSDSIETFALISGLWTSAFAFGAFVGPSISGILSVRIGFRYATLVIAASHLLLGICVIIFLIVQRNKSKYEELEDDKESNSDIDTTGKLHQNSVNESCKSIRSMAHGVSIEKSRPAAMNSLIACSSYKSQVWQRREDPTLNIGPYSHSYGAINSRTGRTSNSLNLNFNP